MSTGMPIRLIWRFILKNTAPGIVVILLGLWIQPAMAYIDPGSGSAIMSAIVGLFVAVGIALKTYWYKIKSFFTGSGSAGEIDPNQELKEDNLDS
jgi:hypothetical protein